jgi:hypothetical protein
MKKGTLYLVSALTITAAITITYVLTKKQYDNVLAEQNSVIEKLKQQLSEAERPRPLDFGVMPSEPISNEYAEQLIENYNCGDTTLTNNSNTTIKGWHIERELIESLFRAYAGRGVDGIQVYLGKHNEANNKSHTLIWMAVKDTTIGSGAGQRKSMKLLMDKPGTVFQYVKPCPLNCPENDFSHRCD